MDDCPSRRDDRCRANLSAKTWMQFRNMQRSSRVLRYRSSTIGRGLMALLGLVLGVVAHVAPRETAVCAAAPPPAGPFVPTAGCDTAVSGPSAKRINAAAANHGIEPTRAS